MLSWKMRIIPSKTETYQAHEIYVPCTLFTLFFLQNMCTKPSCISGVSSPCYTFYIYPLDSVKFLLRFAE